MADKWVCQYLQSSKLARSQSQTEHCVALNDLQDFINDEQWQIKKNTCHN